MERTKKITVLFNGKTVDELEELTKIIAEDGVVSVAELVRFSVYELLKNKGKYANDTRYRKNFKKMMRIVDSTGESFNSVAEMLKKLKEK
jgi:hypothetical protein